MFTFAERIRLCTLVTTSDAVKKIGNYDCVITNLQFGVGAIASAGDVGLSTLSFPPASGGALGGILTKGALFLVVATEASEVLISLSDGNSKTHGSTQLVGGAAMVGLTVASGAVGGSIGASVVSSALTGLVAGSEVPLIGNVVGCIVGGLVGYFASKYGEGAVESAWESFLTSDSGPMAGLEDSMSDIVHMAQIVPDSPEGRMVRAILAGDGIAAAKAALNLKIDYHTAGVDRDGNPIISSSYPDAIIRTAAGYEGSNNGYVPPAVHGPAGGPIPVSGGSSDRGPVRPPTVSVNTSASNGEGAANNGHGPTQAPSGPAGAPISVTKPKPTPPENDYNPPGNEKDNGRRPILLDLSGNGLQITDLNKSTQFIDSKNDGLKHRTAWAASGDGVLFFDADNDNSISQTREYVFTEWDPTAKSDMQALRARFDSNNDGKLTAADAAFAQFKVMVTQADGSQIAQSLTQLGITEIRLTEDATKITLTDGSMINGQSTFVMNGVTRTVASAVLIAETQGYRVVETVTLSGTDRVVVNTGYGADGKVAFVIKSVYSANGLSITNSFDLDGNGVVDRVQSAVTVVNANGSRTETLVNKLGASLSSGVLINRVAEVTAVLNGRVNAGAADRGFGLAGGWRGSGAKFDAIGVVVCRQKMSDSRSALLSILKL